MYVSAQNVLKQTFKRDFHKQDPRCTSAKHGRLPLEVKVKDSKVGVSFWASAWIGVRKYLALSISFHCQRNILKKTAANAFIYTSVNSNALSHAIMEKEKYLERKKLRITFSDQPFYSTEFKCIENL